jgi:uncharacterized membrane protein
MDENATPKSKTSERLGFLDWTRGIAILIILQGHVFHAFLKPDLRQDGSYMISQFLGGIAPAIFLLLTGITLAFIIDKRERQGLGPRDRWYAALRRSGYLFMIAFLFRIQMFVFGLKTTLHPHFMIIAGSPAEGLLRVDVLNLMGFSIGLLSLLAFLTTAQRARWGVILGFAIAFASPVITMINWSWLPDFIAAYIKPSQIDFGFFPWAAFIAFGVGLGSILRMTKAEDMNRLMQWVAIAGFAVFFGGQYCANFPSSLYPNADKEYWLNSPWMVFMKLGPTLLLITVAYLWNEYGGKGWSLARQFGVTSLLVYWVHVELVYGRWFWFWKETFNALQCVAAAAVLIVLMLGLSILRTRTKGRRLAWSSLSIAFSKQPERVPGD